MSALDHAQLDRDHVWHPFTQQQAWAEDPSDENLERLQIIKEQMLRRPGAI